MSPYSYQVVPLVTKCPLSYHVVPHSYQVVPLSYIVVLLVTKMSP